MSRCSAHIPILRLSCDQAAAGTFSLPDIHNDPFDRIIIATACLNHMTILSGDRMVGQYPGVRVMW